MHKLFPIGHLTRQDLVDLKIVTKEEAKKITDSKMEAIARKLGASYTEFNSDLKIIANHELEN